MHDIVPFLYSSLICSLRAAILPVACSGTGGFSMILVRSSMNSRLITRCSVTAFAVMRREMCGLGTVAGAGGANLIEGEVTSAAVFFEVGLVFRIFAGADFLGVLEHTGSTLSMLVQPEENGRFFDGVAVGNPPCGEVLVVCDFFLDFLWFFGCRSSLGQVGFVAGFGVDAPCGDALGGRDTVVGAEAEASFDGVFVVEVDPP